MKKFLLSAAAAVIGLSALAPAASANFDLMLTTQSDEPEYYPIWDILMMFGVPVKLPENAKASIYLGDEVMATADLEVMVVAGRSKVTATFPEKVLLPLGKSYQFVIPEGYLVNEDDETDVNNRVEIPINVPADLGAGEPSIGAGVLVEQAEEIYFRFPTEVQDVNDHTILSIYRDGVKVREYPAVSSAGTGFDGYTTAVFEETVRFEKNVDFSAVIEAGTVCGQYRDDLLNLRGECQFIGNCAEELPMLEFTSCTETAPGLDFLDNIGFSYGEGTVLTGEPAVTLSTGGETLMTVTPEIDKEGLLTADFKHFELLKGEDYEVTVAEASVVTAKGDIRVNQEQSVTFSGLSGVESIGADEAAPEYYDMQGRRVVNPEAGLYIERRGDRVVKTIIRK